MLSVFGEEVLVVVVVVVVVGPTGTAAKTGLVRVVTLDNWSSLQS